MATSDTTASSTISLKLLVDTKSDTVIFAEAGKEFVDFLFTLMSLSVGTVISLLSSNDMVGSLCKLYQSIENISNTYIQPNIDKGTLLNPKIAAVHNNCGAVPLLLPNNDEVLPAGKKMYICSGLANPSDVSGSGNKYRSPSLFGYVNEYQPSSMCKSRNEPHRFVAQDSTAICPQCNNKMSIEVSFLAGNNKIGNVPMSTSYSGEGDGGFVKGVVAYMVMDDLEVTPMSTISIITLLNKFNVNDVGALQEMRVSIGMDEGLKLLKASLQSKTVLTDVFRGRTAA